MSWVFPKISQGEPSDTPRTSCISSNDPPSSYLPPRFSICSNRTRFRPPTEGNDGLEVHERYTNSTPEDRVQVDGKYVPTMDEGLKAI